MKTILDWMKSRIDTVGRNTGELDAWQKKLSKMKHNGKSHVF